MDKITLERISEFICGDDEKICPVYRSGSELTRFFERVGFSNFQHDGSTRKWWTLNILESLTENNLTAVVLRLANPWEYKGNNENANKAISSMNKISLRHSKPTTSL
jgi:hypothetical protein